MKSIPLIIAAGMVSICLGDGDILMSVPLIERISSGKRELEKKIVLKRKQEDEEASRKTSSDKRTEEGEATTTETETNDCNESEEAKGPGAQETDGLQQNMEDDLESPRHRAEVLKQKYLKKKCLDRKRSLVIAGALGRSADEVSRSVKEQLREKEGIILALPRCLIQPPLAPSFSQLQHLVDDVSQHKFNGTEQSQGVDPSALPCLLRGGGCDSEYEAPTETKKDSHSGNELKKTQAMIERAVSKLQEDLDMRTAEVVKEIERRAAEMRRRISQEADSIIEAIKFLVLQLSDSVVRADEMGEGFVREWFDEAENKYVGMSEKESKPLDDDVNQWDDDLKKQNKKGHQEMVSHLKNAVEKTREKYGEPKSDGGMTLDEQLGINHHKEDSQTTDPVDTETETETATKETERPQETTKATTTTESDQKWPLPVHDTHAQTEPEKSLDRVEQPYGFIDLPKLQ